MVVDIKIHLVNIDEEMLTSVAELTGGRYYRATSSDELASIYDEIDLLEQSKVEEIIYTDYEDKYPTYLGYAFTLLSIGFLSEKIWLRKLTDR